MIANLAVYLVVCLAAPCIFYLFILSRREPLPGHFREFLYLAAFFLPLLIPYRWLERILFDTLAGVGGAYAVNALLAAVETTFLAVLVYVLMKEKRPETPAELFFSFLFLGLGFGLGKIGRDVVLVFSHPLHQFYGYSQFSTFLTGPFLIQRFLEILYGVIAAGMAGLAVFRVRKVSFMSGVGLLLLAFLFQQVEGLPRVLFQFIPLFGLFMQSYLVSLLPIGLLLSFAILWLVSRLEARKWARIQ